MLKEIYANKDMERLELSFNKLSDSDILKVRNILEHDVKDIDITGVRIQEGYDETVVIVNISFLANVYAAKARMAKYFK